MLMIVLTVAGIKVGKRQTKGEKAVYRVQRIQLCVFKTEMLKQEKKMQFSLS